MGSLSTLKHFGDILSRKSKTLRPKETEMGGTEVREMVCEFHTQQFPQGAVFLKQRQKVFKQRKCEV